MDGPAVGEIIDGTFRVERELGAGATGTAFAARLVRDWNGHREGLAVCLKWYNKEAFKWEGTQEVVARRVREATVGGSFDHPNLVRVIDTEEFWGSGRPQYLLMELIEGETIEKLAKRGPIPSDQAQRILADLASGLKQLHDSRILHRDVKAANVMRGQDGRAKLLDLGVVRHQTEETMTDTQAFLGTMRFAAPEWLFAENCSPASDVYSLGTIGYHLLTGHEIFSGMKPFTRVIEAVRHAEPPLRTDGWDARRMYLGNLVRRMLSKKPVERPELREVIEALTNERRFEVWAGLEGSGLFQRLPKPFHADGPSQREFVDLVLSVVPEAAFQDIVRAGDYDRLLGYKQIRYTFNLSDKGQFIADYLEVPEADRVAWASDALRHIMRDESLNDGQKIDSRWTVMRAILEAEQSEEVRKAMSPLMEETDADMKMLMDTLAQENPAD